MLRRSGAYRRGSAAKFYLLVAFLTRLTGSVNRTVQLEAAAFEAAIGLTAGQMCACSTIARTSGVVLTPTVRRQCWQTDSKTRAVAKTRLNMRSDIDLQGDVLLMS